MICPSCSREVPEGNYCNSCGCKCKGNYDSVFGVWKVTTEGDCEGRTIKNLGTYTGYIDEIAKLLVMSGNTPGYSLDFKSVGVLKPKNNKEVKSVHVTFSRNYSMYDMESESLKAWGENLFRDRPVKVSIGKYYKSIKLDFK